MKTRLSRGCRVGGTIITAMLAMGCLDQTSLTRSQSAVGLLPATSQPAEAVAPAAGAVDTNQPPARVTAAPTQEIEPALPKLSPGLADFVKLAQSKVSDEVLLAYIEKRKQPFSLTAEDIVYLHDIGVSEAVITALIKRSQIAPAVTGPLPAPVENPPAVGEGAPPVVYESAPAVAVPAVMAEAPQQVAYFYSPLAPYGSWLEVSGYGWCWRPTVAVIDPAWRPYCHGGRWLYTDCGWYWQSDYSWGWAPFHYGRWSYHRHCGWVWVPGSTWAPAWVSWRYSPSYCGWAPLPPEAYYGIGGFSYHSFHVSAGFEFGLTHHYYTFLPIGRFCDPRPYSHFVRGAHASAIYNQCTVVNNYYVGRNTIVNPGPLTRDQVARVSRNEVRKVSVLDLPSGGGRGARPDRLMPAGESLAIYRPTLKSPIFSNAPPSPSRPEQELRKNLTAATGMSGGAVNKDMGARGRSSEAPTTGPSFKAMQPPPRPGVETLAAPQPVTAAPIPPRAAVEQPRPSQPIAPMRPAIRPGLDVTRAPEPVTSVPTPPRAGIGTLAAPSAISPMQPAVRPGVEIPKPMNPTGSQTFTPQVGASQGVYAPPPMYTPQPMSVPTYQRPSYATEPRKPTPSSPFQRSPSSYSTPLPQTPRPSFVNPSAPVASRQTTIHIQPQSRPQYSSPSPSLSHSPSFGRPSYHSAPAPSRPAISAPPPAPRSVAPSVTAPSRPAPAAPANRSGPSRQEIKK